MANSTPEVHNIKNTCENLYTDSYFRILRLKNNLPDVSDEFRNLIRQLDIHCAIQNITKESTEDLKFQMMSEYFSVIDNQDDSDLLPIISDDLNTENYLYSLKEKEYSSELLAARQKCMEIITKKKSVNASVNDGMVCPPFTLERYKINQDNLIQKKLKFQPLSGNSKSIQDETNIKRLPQISNQNKGTSQSKDININYNSTSSLCSKKSLFHTKNSVEIYSDSSLKRRTIEEDEPVTRFSKKQSSHYRRNFNNNCQYANTKSSFMTASSMYRNPLKKCNSKNQETESEVVESSSESSIQNHPSLKNFDSKIVGIILSEIMNFSPDVKWSDIAGLSFVKSTVQEIVIWPLLRPDIFTGLRAPPRGILLFGPPGTGKTLIGKCIATESNSTFFCISASSLASKWVGESEQLVRALFAVAQLHQPAVIFIDEIDSLLSQRSDQEQDHTRKLKTEFLVQFDGAKTDSERRILVVGATNRPHELDEAARRRFVKRLFVPLPDEAARLQIIEKLLLSHQHNLSDSDLKRICDETKGYSGSDVAHLCKEAAMGPIRSIGPEQIKTVSLDQVRSIELIDFIDALKQVRASVAQEDLNYYLDWNKKFGSFPA